MNYWLLKTEPDVFGIDDLAALGKLAEPWNGIRNYQARNIIRDQIKTDDLALIYHSSCKNVGVAGIGKVVSEAYVDPDQFDPESVYFDAKSSPEKPKWFRFDLRFVKKFSAIVSLPEIKSNPELANMVLLKQGRLSVQPVKDNEWKLICQLAQRKS
ncbi:EVE domain-containing protein [Aliikangiella maris]|uniref:EVE domain-containing protein n=2 Tax=Aliikangiella maris TaxID=3162458 RepID=A0ABV3MKE5_9GAMM